MSTPKTQNERSVTPLGIAVAVLIICTLAALALPRLQAVSAERNRPEAPRILSAFEPSRLPTVMFGGGGGGNVSEVPVVP